jgi:probable HAF family extracellular repeat protein
MADEAVRLMPPSLRLALEHHREDLLRGLLEPLTAEDGPAHRPSGDGGTLEAEIAARSAALDEAVRKGKSFRDIARKFGALGHFVADAGFPPAAGGSAGAARYAHFGEFCESRMERFPLVFYGHEDDDLQKGDARGFASDLNEVIGGSCQVTGNSFGAEGTSYAAVVWTVDVAGTTATPGPAVSLVKNHAWSGGTAINDCGDVCGILAFVHEGMPFLAPAGQTAQFLPVPRTADDGHAKDVNNLGEVVGYLHIWINGWSDDQRAYLWKDGSKFDLNKLIDGDSGWARLWCASDINDAGIIAGCGFFDIDRRGFLLTPNP